MLELLPSEREFVALDLETTGLMADTDRIVEIGAVRFRRTGDEIGRFQCLVNPERRMSPAAYAIHGLSDEDLAHARPRVRYYPTCWNSWATRPRPRSWRTMPSFDAGFLGRELARAGLPSPTHSLFDTLALARRRLPMAASHRLDHLAQILALDPAGAHRALADSLRVKEIWLLLDGASESVPALVSYRIFDPRQANPTPEGWEPLSKAAAGGIMVRIEYDGGTRGSGLRSITPRRFVQRGGATYLVAFCHLDSFEKAFRLDRIRSVEIAPEPHSASVPVDRSSAHG